MAKQAHEYKEEILRIEINFPVPVDFPDQAFQHIANIASALCDEWEKHHPGRVMWPAGIGFKITRMPIAAGDERIEFDDNVVSIDCHERADYKAICAKCGKEQGDHKDHWWPNPLAGNCDFEVKSS